jgi:hypothetical protein
MNEELEANGQWSYIFPIEKSDLSSDDKPWLIEGVVTGPGYVDEAGDEFLPEAIQKMADYINENPIPIKDWHGLNPKYNVNTIFDDEMGETTRAWVDEQGQLHVEAELDKTMPGSQWLRDKIVNKKRKFGLSAKGMAAPPVMVSKAGKIVKQIATVIPNEISLTTRPFYQPSLGTVISKAIDEAAEAEAVDQGDKSDMSKDAPKAADAPMSPEDNKDSLLPTVDAEPEKEGVTPVTEIPEPDVMQNVAVAQPVEEVPVEKSEAQLPAALVESLENTIRNIVRQEIGNSKVEPVVPSVAETPSEVAVEKSEVDQPTDQWAVIAKAISDLDAKLERVMENVPEAKAPGVLVQKSEEMDEVRAKLAELPAHERIRLGFQMSEQSLR